VEFATKPQIALNLVKEALGEGMVPAPVLGDNAYGINGEFRDELRRLGLEFFLQIDPNRMTGWAQPVTVERKRTRWHVAANWKHELDANAVLRRMPQEPEQNERDVEPIGP
jgi:SRSO17 transposase